MLSYSPSWLETSSRGIKLKLLCSWCSTSENVIKWLRWKMLGLSFVIFFVIHTQLTQYSIWGTTWTDAIKLPGLVFLKQGGFDFCLVLLEGFSGFYFFFFNIAIARTKTVIVQVCIPHQIIGEKIHFWLRKESRSWALLPPRILKMQFILANTYLAQKRTKGFIP